MPNPYQIITLTDQAAVDIDASLGEVFQITMGGSRTFTLSNSADNIGKRILVRFVQDGTGSRVPTLFTTIKWDGGTAPTFTTTANKTDVMGFLITGSGTYDGFIVGLNK